MTSTIFVKRLNKTGIFSSGINADAAFANKENPQGFFEVIVQPKETYNGNEILYKKVKGGYLIEGEGRIISGNKEEIEDTVAAYRKNHYEKVVLTEEDSLTL